MVALLRVVVVGTMLSGSLAYAQLRFERLTVITSGDREPEVFWNKGRLCVPTTTSGKSSCHDVRAHSEPWTIPTPKVRKLASTVNISWAGVPLVVSSDGDGKFSGEPVSISRMRCDHGRLQPVGYRYVTGGKGEVAVLVLEQDDREVVATGLDAQPNRSFALPRRWSVHYAVDFCREATDSH